MEYTPRENPGEKLGMAFLPILEIPGQAALKSVTYPYGFSLCTELCALMAAMSAPCTVKADEYVAALAKDGAPEVNGVISAKWPGPGKDPTSKKDRPASTPSTGKFLTPFSQLSYTACIVYTTQNSPSSKYPVILVAYL